MRIAIIIPVFNLWEEMTIPCLKSLSKNIYGIDIHIYLIDNASTDQTSQQAEKIGYSLFGKDNFTYIKNEKNLGFAVACNQGAKEAQKEGYKFLFFLNNDTFFIRNIFSLLLKSLEDSKIGIAGPLLLYPQNMVQHCGIVFSMHAPTHIYQNFLPTHCQIKNRKYKMITGAAFLCRTYEFFKYGCFCEEYKNGYEDLDLCNQYAINGQLAQVITDGYVYHFESQTPGRLDFKTDTHNKELFNKRNKVKLDAHLYYASDGYIPAMTKDYIDYIRLSEKMRENYNLYIKNNYSDTVCYNLLLKEPFWHDGYHILIHSLEKQKKFNEAIAICQRVIFFCFCEYNFNLLISLLEKCNDEKLYNSMSSIINDKLFMIKEKRNERKVVFENSFKSNSIWYENFLSSQKLYIYDIIV